MSRESTPEGPEWHCLACGHVDYGAGFVALDKEAESNQMRRDNTPTERVCGCGCGQMVLGPAWRMNAAEVVYLNNEHRDSFLRSDEGRALSRERAHRGRRTEVQA